MLLTRLQISKWVAIDMPVQRNPICVICIPIQSVLQKKSRIHVSMAVYV